MRLIRYLLFVALLLSGTVLAQDDSAETTPEAEASGSTIGFNESVEGLISSGEEQVPYTFEGETGQFVTITLESEDFDSYLYLYGPDGDVIATDDDSAGSLNSRIGPLALPANGTYTIGASSLSGRDTGEFTLHLTTTQVRQIEFGQVIRDELTEDDSEHAIMFTANADDIITIELKSDDFDTLLTLSQVEPAFELSTNDDGGDGTNSRIGPYTIDEDGQYMITVSSYYGTSELGDYSLSLARVVNEPIAFEQAVETTISGSNPLHFVFEGEADQVIDIHVDTDDQLDTRVTLLDPSGESLAEDDDSGGRVDPALDEILLREDGAYYIVVDPVVARDAQTPLTVTLTLSDIPSLGHQPVTVYLDSAFFSRLLQFEADDGEAIRLHFSVASDFSVSPQIEVIQDGVTIAESYAYDIRYTTSLGFDVPDGGNIIIRITEYSGTPLALEVTMERS